MNFQLKDASEGGALEFRTGAFLDPNPGEYFGGRQHRAAPRRERVHEPQLRAGRTTVTGMGADGASAPARSAASDAWLDGHGLQDATLAELTSLRRIPDEEEPRDHGVEAVALEGDRGRADAAGGRWRGR